MRGVLIGAAITAAAVAVIAADRDAPTDSRYLRGPAWAVPLEVSPDTDGEASSVSTGVQRSSNPRKKPTPELTGRRDGAPPPTPTPTSAPPEVGTVQRVVELVNAERRSAGCSDVRADHRLDAAATGHSTDMAHQRYFNHTSLDGRTPWDRAEASGYPSANGENIAKGQDDADAVMRSWMRSPSHRANILNCSSRAMGVGVAKDSRGTPYWTQMFGTE